MVELPGKAGEGFELWNSSRYISLQRLSHFGGPPVGLRLREAGDELRIGKLSLRASLKRHDPSGRRAIHAALSSVLVDGAT